VASPAFSDFNKELPMNRTGRYQHVLSLIVVGLLVLSFEVRSNATALAQDPHDSANVGYDSTSSGLGATTVQGAIDALASKLAGSPPVVGYVNLARFDPQYTVPTDRTLIITNTEGGGGGEPILVGGTRVGGRSVGPSFIVVNEGETIVAVPFQTLNVSGYLIPKSRAPGVGIHISGGGSYTVPAGKELVLTHAVVSITDGLKIDGKSSSFPAPEGRNVNILVGPGQTVTVDSYESGAHGYLR
jgi:hypothetical protein